MIHVAAAEFKAITNPKVEYIYDLSEGFCESVDIRLKYKPLVQSTCDRLMKVLNMGDHISQSFVCCVVLFHSLHDEIYNMFRELLGLWLTRLHASLHIVCAGGW